MRLAGRTPKSLHIYSDNAKDYGASGQCKEDPWVCGACNLNITKLTLNQIK
jgi:hypothetical protein